MKKYKNLIKEISIFLIISFLIIFNFTSCNAEMNSDKDNLVKKEDMSQARKILNKYLDARHSGHFEICVSFLSSEFKKNFSKTYNINFFEHLKSNEAYYRDREIVKYEFSETDIVIFTISVVVEEPGVRSKTIEWYHLIQNDGQWQINDIRYSEEFKIIEKVQPNGSWQKVNT